MQHWNEIAKMLEKNIIHEKLNIEKKDNFEVIMFSVRM